MLTKFTVEEIRTIKTLLAGALLIAEATGKPATEVIDAHLPERKPPTPAVVQMRVRTESAA